MPKNKKHSSDKIKANNGGQLSEIQGKSSVFETLTASFMQGERVYIPTERQFDKLLELREKEMDHFHVEKTKLHQRDWLRAGIFIFVIIVITAVLIAVIYLAPDYIDIVITFLISSLTSGLGGYGFGRYKKQSDGL